MTTALKRSTLDIALIEEARDIDAIYLLPIEAHVGAAEFDEEGFLKWVGWIRDNEQARLVMMGDNIECTTRSSIGDTFTQKLSPEEQMEWTAEALEPIRDRIWAMISGNHEERVLKETSIDPSKWVAKALGIPYCRDRQGVVKARMGQGANGKPICYTIHMAHGKSGARTVGGKLAAANRMTEIMGNADVYIGGHTHGHAVTRGERLIFDHQNNAIREEKYYVVLPGSFLKYAAYAKKSGLAPLGVGCARIRLDGRRKDVHVSV